MFCTVKLTTEASEIINPPILTSVRAMITVPSYVLLYPHNSILSCCLISTISLTPLHRYFKLLYRVCTTYPYSFIVMEEENLDYEPISDDEDQISINAPDDVSFELETRHFNYRQPSTSPISVDSMRTDTPERQILYPDSANSNQEMIPLHLHIYFSRQTDPSFPNFNAAHAALTTAMAMTQPTTANPPGHLHFAIHAFTNAEVILENYLRQALAPIVPSLFETIDPNVDARDLIDNIRTCQPPDARLDINTIRNSYTARGDNRRQVYAQDDAFTVTIQANNED